MRPFHAVKQLDTVLVFIGIRYSNYCYYVVIIRNTFCNYCIRRQERISSLGPVNP